MTPLAGLGQRGRERAAGRIPSSGTATAATAAAQVLPLLLLMQRACVDVEEGQSGLGLQALRRRRQTGKLKLTPPKRYST